MREFYMHYICEIYATRRSTKFCGNFILGRPLSSLSSQGRRSKQRYHHFNNADSFDANNGSQLQVS